MNRVTTGYLFKVTIYTVHMSSNGSHICQLVSWSTDHTRSVKLGTECFHMLNVVAHHLWVQFSKSTLLW